MVRRTVLTRRQRVALFCVPEREADRLCHYTLRDAGLENINARRRPRNKLVFALQLCVLRYSGRLLAPSKLVARSRMASLVRLAAQTSGLSYHRADRDFVNTVPAHTRLSIAGATPFATRRPPSFLCFKGAGARRRPPPSSADSSVTTGSKRPRAMRIMRAIPSMNRRNRSPSALPPISCRRFISGHEGTG